MDDQGDLTPNRLVRFLDKAPDDFTRSDLVRFIEQNDVRMVNFRYVGEDGRLKLLNFVINDRRHLERILSMGERVDGSNLFSYIEPSASDLYVVPRYRSAYVNPFAEVPTLDLLCSYYDRDGDPLDAAPEHVLGKADRLLRERTGHRMEAFGELEFYLSSELDRIYRPTPQRGYHESHPFAKWELVRTEAMRLISEMGGRIKYGHSEVGNIVSGQWEYVQHEIEFLPSALDDAADQLVVAKWVIREVAYKYGLEVSFAPKIILGHAGSGLHIHSRLVRDGENAMVDERGSLSDTARKMIAGLLELAPSLSAFGNRVPTSFLRLVPHQEAPTRVCWGESNRSVLVRVPLGWEGVGDMISDANPQEPPIVPEGMSAQTVEFRSADGSANAHLLLAGMAVAARRGLQDPQALELAERLHVGSDPPGSSRSADLPELPSSCCEAGERLLADRTSYEEGGVFPPGMIDGLARALIRYDDRDLSERVFGDGDALEHLVEQYLHYG